MNTLRMRQVIASGCLVLMLMVSSCGNQKEPSRWDNAQQQSTQKVKKTPAPQVSGTPLPKKAVKGGKLNRFLPTGGGDYKRVYTQEKAGFVEAKLNKDGKNVAMLSITDLASNPQAAEKFKTSTEKIAGYPAVKQGNSITAILVGNRYQVKVQSKNPSFTDADRATWLQKFNLSGLANLK